MNSDISPNIEPGSLIEVMQISPHVDLSLDRDIDPIRFLPLGEHDCSGPQPLASNPGAVIEDGWHQDTFA
jgi:hypothetical protein